LLAVALIPLSVACNPADEDLTQETGMTTATDPHSFSRPEEVVVRHLALDLAVDFASRTLSGRASLDLENLSGADELYLDTRGLRIDRVYLDDGEAEAGFRLGDDDPLLGRALIVDIEPSTERVHIDYTSDPAAEAVQWLSPAQTAGGEQPFLFTQSQAILARTWVPCQDTPAVRMSYEAKVTVPAGLMAVMSAENPTDLAADGVYSFRMPQPIPSYLLALAVGDLEFRPLGPRTGVYAEPSVVEAAQWEFEQTEAMIDATEALYGPYRWGRYDLLVLPPSFPFGGMENPRLTFATPTIIAGDRSLVALVAHELAHSWSGNLVTNATWNDFWLNEGFTSYIENRIMEAVNGEDYATMLRALSAQDLAAEVTDLGADSPDTHLFLDLAGRNPDDGMNAVAYDKGAALLRLFEETVGRAAWDQFLNDYFESRAFQSIDTASFVAEVTASFPQAAEAIDLDAWIHGPGLPANFPTPASDRFLKVEEQVVAWSEGGSAGALETEGWTTHEWLHFVRNLPAGASVEELAKLDDQFGFTESGNSEVRAAWLEVAIREGYAPAYPALEEFLTTVGRRKFLKPLYTELARTEDGLARGREIYAKARAGYHSVSANTIDAILGWEG
jgi:aminopeptidase N